MCGALRTHPFLCGVQYYSWEADCEVSVVGNRLSTVLRLSVVSFIPFYIVDMRRNYSFFKPKHPEKERKLADGRSCKTDEQTDEQPTSKPTNSKTNDPISPQYFF